MAPAPQSQTRKGKSSGSGKSAASGTKGAKARSRAGQDAVALLKADHRSVEKLFSQFAKASGEQQKRKLADQICTELKTHSQIEEEILYPMSRDYLDDEEIVNEAVVEHASAKELIAQIEGMSGSDEMLEAKVTVLQEMIEHHVQEEEKQFFPQLQKTDMDLKVVGERLAARKQEVMRSPGGGGRAARH